MADRYWAMEVAGDQNGVHIMKARHPVIMSTFDQILLGPANKFSLCSKRAVRHREGLTPEHVTCTECRVKYERIPDNEKIAGEWPSRARTERWSSPRRSS